MPSKKTNVKPADVVDSSLTTEEMEAAQQAEQEVLEAEAMEVPVEEVVEQKLEEEEEVATPEPMKKTYDFTQCAWAGDPGDSNCAKCNGYDMYPADGTGVIDAAECSGYEEGPAPESWEKDDASPDVEIAVKEAVKVERPNYTAKAQTSRIRAEISITQQIKNANNEDVWCKASYSETRSVPEGLTGEEVQQEIDDLWACVEAETDYRLKDAVDRHL